MNHQEIYLFLKTLIDINRNEGLGIDSLSLTHKEFMVANGYIQPGQVCYELTEKGYKYLEENSDFTNPVIIRYPLLNKGTIKAYNKAINTSSTAAKNAILCAITNEDMIKDVEVKSFRVFMQYLLDKEYHKKMGETLINKWYNVLKESKEFFDSKKK